MSKDLRKFIEKTRDGLVGVVESRLNAILARVHGEPDSPECMYATPEQFDPVYDGDSDTVVYEEGHNPPNPGDLVVVRELREDHGGRRGRVIHGRARRVWHVAGLWWAVSLDIHGSSSDGDDPAARPVS